MSVIEQQGRKIVVTVPRESEEEPMERTGFRPHSFFFGLNGIKVWQSFMNYSTRLLSYPIQFINLVMKPGDPTNGLPDYGCPIESVLYLNRYRNYQDEVL